MSKRPPQAQLAEELRALRELFSIPRRDLVTAGAASDYEKVDPRPLEPPVDLEEPLTLTEMVRQQVRQEISQQAAEAGLGTFEEEDDFEEEDPDLLQATPWELTDEELHTPFEFPQEEPDHSPADQGGEADQGSEATADTRALAGSSETEPPPG